MIQGLGRLPKGAHLQTDASQMWDQRYKDRHEAAETPGQHMS